MTDTIGFNNNARSKIEADITADATTITIPNGDYAYFLESDDDYYYAVLRNALYREIIKIDISASSSSAGLSVTRGQESTSGRVWAKGTQLFQSITADTYGNFVQEGGHRSTGADPNGVITPSYAGEKIMQTGIYDCEIVWWQSIDAVNTVWKQITADGCSIASETVYNSTADGTLKKRPGYLAITI